MTWLNWAFKLHSGLRTIPHLILTHNTQDFVQRMLISFVWLYLFKCDVCMLNHMWIKPKRFLFFLFAFGSDLYHSCFSKFFKLFLCEKHVFWVFSWLISCLSSVTSERVQFASFSALDREFRDCFAAVSRVRLTCEIPARYQRNFAGL